MGASIYISRNDRCLSYPRKPQTPLFFPGTLGLYDSQAIYVLSGDQTFHAVGEKTGIPYLDYHNYYRQLLTSNSAWAKSVIMYFNNALFPASSSVVPAPQASGQIDDVDWEAEFERAVLVGSNAGPISAPRVPVQAVNGPSISDAIFAHAAPPAPPIPPLAPAPPIPPLAPAPPPPISSPVNAIPIDSPPAALSPPADPPPAPTPPAVVPTVPAPTAVNAAAPPAAKAKTSSKRKGKSKATDTEGAGEADAGSAVSVRRSGRKTVK